MDIQTRKITFIEEFLKIQSNDILSQFEKLLLKNTKEKQMIPFTNKELENRIITSEKDFTNGNFKTSTELLEKFT